MKCDYCGDDADILVQIINPNFDDFDKPFWNVCVDCSEVIKAQQDLSFGSVIVDRDNVHAQRIGEKLVSEAIDKLEEVSKRVGKPIMCSGFVRRNDGAYDEETIIFRGGLK